MKLPKFLTAKIANWVFALLFILVVAIAALRVAPRILSSSRDAAFLGAIRRGDVASFKSMLKKNPSLAKETFTKSRFADLGGLGYSKDSFTALNLAVLRGYEEIVALLLENGADPNAQVRNSAGIQFASPPICEAAGLGPSSQAKSIAMIKALLAHGADVNTNSGSRSGTPLYTAASAGSKDVVEFLLLNKADSNPQGDFGTPLHVAAMLGHKDIVEVLLAHGADVNAKRGLGETPLDIARDQKGIVEILLAKGAKQGRTEPPPPPKP